MRPVAWRWRAKVKGEWGLWSVADVDPNDWLWREYWQELEVRPLYANHEARGDGVRVTETMVDAALEALGIETQGQEPSDSHPWISRDDMRAALEAALPPLGDGRAEIVEECAKVADALAERQAETNRKYPDHVKAYPAWEAYVSKYREVAAAIRFLSNPGGRE